MGENSRCFIKQGKGDAPRSCWSKRYKDNFDQIKWCSAKDKKQKKHQKKS